MPNTFLIMLLCSSDPGCHNSRVSVGAMKNVKMDYVPRWAMHLEEKQWLNAIKQGAAAKVRSCPHAAVLNSSHVPVDLTNMPKTNMPTLDDH